MATSNEFIQRLQKVYGDDWHIRLNPSDIPSDIPAATRLTPITEEDVSQGLAMTLWEDGRHGPLAEQLADQLKAQCRL